MIDQLIKIGQELEPGLRDLFSNEAYRRMIIGVSLDVDPYWEAAELFSLYGRFDRWYDRFDGYIGKRPNYRDGYEYFDSLYGSLYRTRRALENIPADFDYRPGNWSSYCISMRYPRDASPVLIRVSINAPLNPNDERFPTVFRERFAIIYEEKKTPAKLITTDLTDFAKKISSRLFSRRYGAAPEVFSEDHSQSGTIGGILRGVLTNKLYLVTCGHVLGDKGSIALSGKRGRRRLGEVVHFAMPPVSLTPDACSAITHPDERSVDISVVALQVPNSDIPDIENLTVPGSITPVSEIRINDEITFLGKKSGRVKARMGPLTLWYPFEQKGIQRCFGLSKNNT